MSIKVGLSHSEDDIDIQGEIDFDFFETSDGEKATEEVIVISSSVVPNPEQTAERSELSSHENGIAQPEQNAIHSNLAVVSMEINHGSHEDSNPCIHTDTPSEEVVTQLHPQGLCSCIELCSCPKLATGNSVSNEVESNKLADEGDPDENLDCDENGESLSSSVSVTDSDDLSSLTGESLGALSDSESITDVTPLHSPYYCDSPIPQPRPPERVSTVGSKEITRPAESKLQSSESEKSDVSSKKVESIKFSGDVKDSSRGSLDLNLVVEAIKQLEVPNKRKSACPRQCITPPLIKGRKNMSFSNEEVRRIDRDNQLLLKKILSQQGRPKSGSVGQLMCSHRASSAINRQKQQKQIETENLALLKRIELAKPSKDLCRDHLLRDYNRLASMRHGSRPSSRPSSVIQQPSTSLSGSIHSSRSSSLSSLQSGAKPLEQTKSHTPLHSRVRNIRGLNGKLSHSASSSPV